VRVTHLSGVYVVSPKYLPFQLQELRTLSVILSARAITAGAYRGLHRGLIYWSIERKASRLHPDFRKMLIELQAFMGDPERNCYGRCSIERMLDGTWLVSLHSSNPVMPSVLHTIRGLVLQLMATGNRMDIEFASSPEDRPHYLLTDEERYVNYHAAAVFGNMLNRRFTRSIPSTPAQQ
jgi:hypothetical protein